MDFKAEIAALYDGMIELRRDFHRHPELGLQEFRTAQIVEEHRRIFEAIKAGDADLAEQLTTEHISNAKKSILERVKQHG